MFNAKWKEIEVRSSLITAAMCAAALLGVARQASAQDMRVRVHNNSSETVFHIYASPTWKSNYGNRDLLGSVWLDPGESVVVDFRNSDGECRLDVKAEGSRPSIKWTKRMDVCDATAWRLND